MSESRARARRRSARTSPEGRAKARREATIVKARDSGEVLSAVPFLCGFEPEHSLVVISLRGPRHRIGLVTRVDLPSQDAYEEAAVETLEYLRRDEAVAAVVIVYDDAPWSPGAQPHRGLAVKVSARLETDGIAVKEALYVAGGRFWSYQCSDERCCTVVGRPMSEVKDSSIAAAFVLAGVAPLTSREALVARVAPADPDMIGDVETRAVRWLQAHARDIDGAAERADRPSEFQRASRARRLHWLTLTIRTICRQLEDYARGRDLAPDVSAQLLAALTDVEIRDVVMALFCQTGLPDLPADMAPDLPARSVDALADLVEGLDDARDVMEELVERLLVDLSTRAEGWLACAPLTLLAWHSWARGEGALARVAAERAMAEDPTYRLARLVVMALDAGLAPDWVDAVRAEDRDAG